MRVARNAAVRCYALLLTAFPREHREHYAREMVDAFERELAACTSDNGAVAALRFSLVAYVDVVKAGLGERRRSKRTSRGPALGEVLVPFGRDLTHAVRALSKSLTFSLVCILSLAVGLGGVVGVIVFLRVMWIPAAGVDPDGLVEFLVKPLGPARAEMGGRVADTWSYPDFIDVRDAVTGMETTGWLIGDGVLRAPDGQGTERVPLMHVSANYFRTVGVTPVRGRGFVAADAEASAPPVVVVGYGLWQNRLGARSDIVGSTLIINRIERTVVGIAPDRFRGHRTQEGGRPVDLWLPLEEHPFLIGEGGYRRDRNVDWFGVIARLSNEGDIDRANAALSTVMSRLASTYPETNEDKGAEARAYSGVPAQMHFEMMLVQGMLLTLSGIVLLVVCFNVAGMVLVRSATRERELAVRLALGSSRWRLVRYMMSEAVVLAIAGGALAAVFIFGALRLLFWRLQQPLPEALQPDPVIVVICIGLSLATTLAFALLPAVRFSHSGVFSALKDGAGGGGRRVRRIQRVAAAVQAGIAMPFLVVGVLYLNHARATATADFGFVPQEMFASAINLSAAGYSNEEAEVFLRGVRVSIQQIGGVTSVAVADGVPLDFVRRTSRVARLDDPARVRAQTTRVDGGYFATIGTPILRGRDFDATDRSGTEPVVVITEVLATQLWPGEDALGQHLAFALDGSVEERFTVVGVAADVAGAQLDASRQAVFVPLSQHPTGRVIVVARASTDPEAMALAIQKTVADLDPDLLRPTVITGADLVEESVDDFIVASIISGMFSVIALTLAALGIYGVVAFMVTGRTREFGVRMAIGAPRSRVVRIVFADGVKLALPGLLGGAFLTSVFLRVKTDIPNAPLSAMVIIFAVAAGTALTVVLLSSVGPALRAAGTPPVEAMRSE